MVALIVGMASVAAILAVAVCIAAGRADKRDAAAKEREELLDATASGRLKE